MPELPEVETMRRGILAVEGLTIETAERTVCNRRPIAISPRIDHFHRRVAGRRVQQVGRLGKRVVLHLEDSAAIVFEPRMTGIVLLADPPSAAHLRFRLGFRSRKVRQLLFWDRRGLGTIRLYSARQLAETYGPDQLGPDALEISVDQLRGQLRKSRREIKVALLDQRAVAGIGNLYAAEILHLAGIHPQARCDLLQRTQWEAIHAAMLQVLHKAIRYEGSTLGDGTYRNALNEEGTYQNHHRVYGRAEEVCKSCGKAVISRIVQAQRSTFFCPACQTRRPRRG